MTSPPALSYETVYHIYNRGTNRQNIFIEKRNYPYFLALYEKYITPVADTYAYCLMGNHFHLLIRTKPQSVIEAWVASHRKRQTTPSLQLSHFFNAYAKAINKAYDRCGSLMQHPYGRRPVVDWEQFQNTLFYIHLNPRKHGFVDNFRLWPYSSYPILVLHEATFLRRAELLQRFGGQAEFEAAHRAYEHSASWLMTELEENLEAA